MSLQPGLISAFRPVPGSLSSGSAVATLSIQLRVHSGQPGEEIRLHCHTWLMSLCSSTPSLLPLSLAQYPTHVLSDRAGGEGFCTCAVQMRDVYCVSRREGEEMERMQGMEANKYTGTHSKRGMERN